MAALTPRNQGNGPDESMDKVEFDRRSAARPRARRLTRAKLDRTMTLKAER